MAAKPRAKTPYQARAVEDLKAIFAKHKCDKGPKHQYELIYGIDFSKLRTKPLNILEIGVFNGASVSAWLEFFPCATIYTVDIFTRVEPQQIPVLSDPRVHWLKGDSTDPWMCELVQKKWPGVMFDIIIDDGLHTPEANAATFMNFKNCLATDGTYYIEDVWPFDNMTPQDRMHEWIKKNSGTLNVEAYATLMSALDGFDVVRRDMRPWTGHPDSYIIQVSGGNA